MNLPLRLLSAIALTAVVSSSSAQSKNWPQFRGAGAQGVMDGAKLPAKWDVSKKEGVLWKTAIPGLSHCSPVVWGDKVFITTAISGKPDAELKVGLYGNIDSVNDTTEHEWRLICVNRKTGKVEWERTLHKGVPKIKRHTKATHANTTVATDGKRIVVFLGSEGLHCLTTDGKPVWKRDLGVLESGYFVVPGNEWGWASSPIIHGDKVVLQVDARKESYVAVLKLSNGETIWKTSREEVPTWSTPAVSTEGGRSQVIVNGWKHIGGYDLQTGKELWKIKGGGDIPVPTPIVSKGLVFITNAHGRMAPIYAVKLSAEGDGTPADMEGAAVPSQLAWWVRRGGNYMQTPLVYGDYLYMCLDNGVMTCYEAATGKQMYQQRLGTGRTGFTASPVASDGKLYFTSELGDVMVVKAGPTFELLSQNVMDEVCMATPAIATGMLLYRTQGHLVAIGEANAALK